MADLDSRRGHRSAARWRRASTTGQPTPRLLIALHHRGVFLPPVAALGFGVAYDWAIAAVRSRRTCVINAWRAVLGPPRLHYMLATGT